MNEQNVSVPTSEHAQLKAPSGLYQQLGSKTNVTYYLLNYIKLSSLLPELSKWFQSVCMLGSPVAANGVAIPTPQSAFEKVGSFDKEFLCGPKLK